MQLLPHAFPLEQTRQHFSAVMQAAGADGALTLSSAGASLALDESGMAMIALTKTTTTARFGDEETTIFSSSPRQHSPATMHPQPALFHGHTSAAFVPTTTRRARQGESFADPRSRVRRQRAAQVPAG